MTAPAALAYSNSKALWHLDRLAVMRAGGIIAPVQVQMILSDLCDQNCVFCNYRMEKGTSHEQFGEVLPGGGYTTNPNRKIPTQKALEILDDAADFNVRAIQFTGGGEPLVHPEHLKIFRHALDLGLESALVSNLWHLKDGWRDVLPRMSWIRASLDAATQESYAKIRRTPESAFNRVLANISSLSQQLAWSGSNCLFGAGFVITPDNWHELADAARLLSGLGVKYVRLSAMFSTEGTQPYSGIHEKILDEIAKAKEYQSNDFKVVDLYGDRISDLELQQPDYQRCGYQQFNVYIGGNLKVYRCCTTAYTAHGEIGDLSRQRFSAWLSSRDRKALVTTFDARTCSLCQFNAKNREINAVIDAPEPLHVNFPEQLDQEQFETEFDSVPDFPAEAFDSPLPGVDEATFAKIASQIILMIPHRPQEGVTDSQSIANGYWARWGMHTAFPPDEFAGEIAFTRAGMVRRFLDICRDTGDRFKFLVMIDNDEIIAPVAPIALAFNDVPVVTGVVASPSEYGKIRANFLVNDIDGKPRFPTLKHTKVIPARGLREIHAAGGGLLCIRRDVVEALVARGVYPFLMNGDEHEDECKKFWASGSKKMGEDTHFSRQVRDAGFKLYVDFSVGAGHLKQVVVIWPQGYIDPNMDPASWLVDAEDLPLEGEPPDALR